VFENGRSDYEREDRERGCERTNSFSDCPSYRCYEVEMAAFLSRRADMEFNIS
jgi:hypothetical protein